MSFSHLPQKIEDSAAISTALSHLKPGDMGGVSVQNAGCYSFKATAPRGLPMPKISSRGLDPGRLDQVGSFSFGSFKNPSQIIQVTTNTWHIILGDRLIPKTPL